MSDMQLSLRLGHEAAQDAADHADRVHGAWSDQAMAFLCEFAKSNGPWVTEDVRVAAAGIVPDPPDARAWGQIVLAAARSKMISRVGYARTKCAVSHGRPMSLWQWDGAK